MSAFKPVAQIIKEGRKVWIGNGFHVSQMLNLNKVGKYLNPFLVLDYNAPMDFEPNGSPRGIKFHPHRGIETVTIAYDGAVTHCDTGGHSDTVTGGGVQWMTAGSGILHEERQSTAFVESGGRFEMIQMWINLPKAHKWTDPKYQVVGATGLPKVRISDKGFARVIAGSYRGYSSPIETFTPMTILDLSLAAGDSLEVSMPDNYSAGLFVRKGLVTVNDSEADDSSLVVFERDGNKISIGSPKRSDMLLFFGEALEEPFVGRGPFVMNTEEEIKQAFRDFKSGKFGPVPGPSVLDNPTF